MLSLGAVFVFTGCSNKIVLSKDTWQGIYYPEGCLTCVENYAYSPVFDNFDDCKTWALNKKSDAYDKVVCNKNCEYSEEYKAEICEDVVRNWQASMESVTFENYKE